jgi:hypothetical protein
VGREKAFYLIDQANWLGGSVQDDSLWIYWIRRSRFHPRSACQSRLDTLFLLVRFRPAGGSSCGEPLTHR